MTATAALSGFRPTANALGAGSSTINTRGILAICAAMDISSTMLKSCGWSFFSISRAPAICRSTSSPCEFVKSHITSQTTPATTPPISAPSGRLVKRYPNATPVPISKTPIATTIQTLRRRLLSICSHTELAPSGPRVRYGHAHIASHIRFQLNLTLGTSRSAPISISNSSARANPPLMRLAGKTSRALL